MMRIPTTMADDEWLFWLKQVSKQRKDKIKKLRRESDRLRSVFGAVLLDEALRNLGIFSYTMHYNEYKKPYLKNEEIYFNISHSGEYVLCGLSTSEIGVDIECIEDIDIQSGCLVFSDEEMQLIQSADQPVRMFYKQWTKKESLIKALGCGFFMPTKSIDLSFSEIYDGWRIRSYEFEHNFVSLCTKADEFPREIVLLDYETFRINRGFVKNG